VEPSPNVQSHELGVFVEVSVNWTVNGAVPDVVDEVKLATGSGGVTLIRLVLVIVLLPPLFFAVRETEYVPEVE
jgi:hypothetical protein